MQIFTTLIDLKNFFFLREQEKSWAAVIAILGAARLAPMTGSLMTLGSFVGYMNKALSRKFNIDKLKSSFIKIDYKNEKHTNEKKNVRKHIHKKKIEHFKHGIIGVKLK